MINSNLIFELKNVCFSYLGKFPALYDIDITVRQGEKITFIGANGSGKTTLLHILDGLIFPDKGIIKAFGGELKENIFNDENFSRDFRKKVGLVFQNSDIQLFCPTVKEDILFGPLQLGIDREEINRRMEELVDILNLKKLLDRAPHQLSIGEKRVVALASTLIINPEVLLLDEPTAGLDPSTTIRILNLLIKENISGKTIITSTHDLNIVDKISDTIYVLSQDKTIIKCGKPQEILNNERLLQNNNLLYIYNHLK